MSTQRLLVTELPIHPEHAAEAGEAWAKATAGTDQHAYIREDGAALLLVTDSERTPPPTTATPKDHLWEEMATFAEGDFRRELVELIEEPKPSGSALPETKHIQLRHVEVPPSTYPAYRQWREETIFDVVRHAPEVASFAAYHTVLSTRPGVVFVSAFDGDVEDYRKVFSSERYRKIVSDAGSSYITGGNNGLATHIYHRLPQPTS